jgi:hypothetical protein
VQSINAQANLAAQTLVDYDFYRPAYSGTEFSEKPG